MYEENNFETLPKYFKNLHLEVSAITGSPRIVNTKQLGTPTDKYINIPQTEWESAILNWAGNLDKGYTQITKDGNFVIAGKVDDDRPVPNLIKSLQNLIRILLEERL